MDNEDKTVSFEDTKKEIKKKEVEEIFNKYVKDPSLKVMDWAASNPVKALSLAGLGTGLLKKGLSYRKTVLEERRRNRDFYDPRTGDHATATRNITPSERVEIIRRHRDNKESYAEILYQKGILK